VTTSWKAKYHFGRQQDRFNGEPYTKAHWKLFHALNEAGVNFFSNYKATPKGPVIDFLISPDITVEVDGGSHRGSQLERDEWRTTRLVQLGYKSPLRFSDREVMRETARVIREIKEAIAK